jgi:hypothetical protein
MSLACTWRDASSGSVLLLRERREDAEDDMSNLSSRCDIVWRSHRVVSYQGRWACVWCGVGPSNWLVSSCCYGKRPSKCSIYFFCVEMVRLSIIFYSTRCLTKNGNGGVLGSGAKSQ